MKVGDRVTGANHEGMDGVVVGVRLTVLTVLGDDGNYHEGDARYWVKEGK